ncbi:MAG: hypothetical protein ACKOWH_04005, partial [Rhodoluna sp.]
DIPVIVNPPVRARHSISETPPPVNVPLVASSPVAPPPVYSPPPQAPLLPSYAPPVSAPGVAKNLFDQTPSAVTETGQNPLFSVSPNLNLEPQTASIIIQPIDPLANLNISISETGEMLRTGSIELPNLNTQTGEIATVESTVVDDAITQDSIAGYVSTIAPMRASGVVNTSGKIGIMPKKRVRGQGQVYLMLSVSIFMVAVGGLLLGAFMLGFFK